MLGNLIYVILKQLSIKDYQEKNYFFSEVNPNDSVSKISLKSIQQFNSSLWPYDILYIKIKIMYKITAYLQSET